MLGDGAAARAGWGHQDPPLLLWLQGLDSQPGSSVPDTAWLQEHSHGTATGKEIFTVIQLRRKFMYWCCAAAAGIEKNGKLGKETYKPHKQPHVCHLPARFLVLSHPLTLWSYYFLF